MAVARAVTPLPRRATPANDESAAPGRKAQQALELLNRRGLEIFRGGTGEVWFSLLRDDGVGRATLKLDRLRTELRRLAFQGGDGHVSASTIENVSGLLEGMAHANPPRRVFVRIGCTPGHVFIDLAEPDSSRAIAVNADGWSITTHPPVAFHRPATLRPLPEPRRGEGSLDDLRRYLRFDEGSPAWHTSLAFLLTATMPPELEPGEPCPRPLLIVSGEHGCGKSVRCEALVRLIDPREGLSGTMPEDPRELSVHAASRWMLLFDNATGSPQISDALCRLADGAGFSVRALHTNSDEIVFAGSRSMIINGIDAAPRAADLASRSLRLELPPLPEGQRAAPRELLVRFRAFHSGALADLCDLLVAALRGYGAPYVPCSRLAEAEAWVASAEGRLGWPVGETARLFLSHARAGSEQALEADAVGQAVLAYLAQHQAFEGNAARLLQLLNEAHVGKFPHGWPETPRGLRARLSRALDGLRDAGVVYVEGARRTFRISLEDRPDA